MKNILLRDELIDAVKNQTFIKNGVVSSCEGIKYDFRLSNRILTPETEGAFDVDTSNLEARKVLFINPGEAVYVMTEEELEMPSNMFCQLSLKRKLSHEGIIVLGGFIIDPSYKGRLIFGLYNISSIRYSLKPGKKLVAGVFSKLDEEISYDDADTPRSIYDFPENLEQWVKKFKPLSPEALSNEVSNFKIDISRIETMVNLLRDKIEKDDKWQETFQNNLEKLQDTVEKIAEQLGNEVETRKKETSELKVKLGSLKATGTIIGCLLSIIGTLLVLWLTGLLNI